MSAAKVTIDHDEIRAWVEERGGFPAHVKRGSGENDLGILRIDYPGYSGEDSLERVEWDQWFEAFDEDGLAFLHQDQLESGEQSRFSKLISRDSEQAMDLATKSGEAPKAKSTPSKTTAAKKSAAKKAPAKKAAAKKASHKN
jgi:hypothetical protein